MSISRQDVLNKQMATFSQAVDAATRQTDRKILLMCREELGLALTMHAVRRMKLANPEDKSPVCISSSDTLRARSVEFPSGSRLWHGMRSLKTLVNLKDLTDVFLEIPSDTAQMMLLMDNARTVLRTHGQIIVIDARLLRALRQKSPMRVT